MERETIQPVAARVLTAEVQARNERVLGSVVDESVKRSAEARERRRAEEAQRREAEARARRAEEHAAAEREAARASSEERRALEAEQERRTAELRAWLAEARESGAVEPWSVDVAA